MMSRPLVATSVFTGHQKPRTDVLSHTLAYNHEFSYRPARAGKRLFRKVGLFHDNTARNLGRHELILTDWLEFCNKYLIIKQNHVILN